MMPFIINRIFSGIIVIFGITIFAFLLIHLIPGDPVKIMLGSNATVEQVDRLTNQLGLNEPPLVQYGHYLSNLVQGDLGTSLRTGRPVLTEILDRFPATIKLAGAGIVLAVIFGVILGVLAAKYEGTFIDTFVMGVAVLGMSIPGFWLGIILMMIFSVQFGLLPIAEGTGLKDIILPAFTIGVLASAIISRVTRSGMVETLSTNYIRTARSKGLNELTILLRHAFRNVLIPVITVVGLQIATLLGGIVVIELVFNWPGIGTLAIDAVSTRDFPLIQGTILFMGIVYVVINLLVDISYSIIDPRVEMNTKEEN